MAAIKKAGGDGELRIWPYRRESDEDWIFSQVAFQSTHHTMSVDLSLNTGDLKALLEMMDKVVGLSEETFMFESSDGDFIFGGESVTPDIITIWWWQGEPAAVMQGFRFYVAFSDFVNFIAGLRDDLQNIEPPGGTF